MLKTYLETLLKISQQGDAREESYYSALESLLNAYARSIDKKHIHITTLPKKTDAGNPDFRIWDGKQHIVGYIEAKEPTSVHLDNIESSEQLNRYRYTFPNLILTNFFEFRLYRNGICVENVQIARSFIVHRLRTIPPVENEPAFLNLLEKYFSFSLPQVHDAHNLAVELAKRTRFLKDEIITTELREETNKDANAIRGFYEAFKQYLIAGLSAADFADLYSQTITYGLFAARTRAGETFSRKAAFDAIPHTIGILRDVFRFISLGDLPKQMEWIVDDISEVLAVADVNSILHRYFHEGKGKDPIVHFYETFLSEYDPATRERRGVYYTPESVVLFIVRSLHKALKDLFKRKDGLASDSVTVLDPAAGTLTFLAEASKCAIEEFIEKYGDGGKIEFIKEHILKNFHAFELIMAPYAIGHLKMAFLLEEMGYTLQEDDRFKLYLTNTLEMEDLAQTSLPGMSSLSEESHLAGAIKKHRPILVIMGNPPYSGHSSNFGEWISDEIKTYFKVDGKPLGERNPKWLQDDYVKFIRFAQWKIDQTGEGIIGFITNHSYLDNPTFRGMRRSLMTSFNEIFILDLHGNSLKKETCPDGSKDENVFDIRQGVAIALFIKRKNDKSPCSVFHSELWGTRQKKYSWLESNDFRTASWNKLAPKPGFYFFVPRDEKLLKLYEKSLKITDIFPINSVGITTSRDDFVIDFTKDALEHRIRMFMDKKMPDEIISQTFNLKDKENWKLSNARENVGKDKHFKAAFTKILYRPFDTRWIFYHDEVVERPRRNVMEHVVRGENVGLITNRQVNDSFFHAFCSHVIINDCSVSLETKERSYFFPLFLYPEKTVNRSKSHIITMTLFEPSAEYAARVPNINKNLYTSLHSNYSNDISPKQILAYCYGVLYSTIYRTRFSEFLKTDFPRIPFTNKFKLFLRIADLGQRLIDLHLLESKELDHPFVKFQGAGNGRVDKVRYAAEECRVYLNDSSYFEGVTPEIWYYHIGGYQVCEKWLKDRKEKHLSLEEIKHYCSIAASLRSTIDIQVEIDQLYPLLEADIIAPILEK